MSPFVLFRVWLRRAPVSNRVSAATVAVVQLRRPPDNGSRGLVRGSRPGIVPQRWDPGASFAVRLSGEPGQPQP